MKTIFYFLAFISLASLFACSKSATNEEKDPYSAKIGLREESITLSLKECKNISFGNDHLVLCLDSLSDSRCPLNANCIWGGIAIAKLSFTKKGQLYPVELAIPPYGNHKQTQTVAGYTINLINVLPYPIVPPSGPIAAPTNVEIKINNY